MIKKLEERTEGYYDTTHARDQLAIKRDEALNRNDLSAALAISDYLGENCFEGSLDEVELEDIRQSDRYRSVITMADRFYDTEINMNRTNDTKVIDVAKVIKGIHYGDNGPMDGKYETRRERSKKGKVDQKNLALYQESSRIGLTPENAYDNLHLVRRLLVEQRQMSAVLVGSDNVMIIGHDGNPEIRRRTYSQSVHTAPIENVVKSFISSYNRGKNLSKAK